MPLIEVEALGFDDAPGVWPADILAELERNETNGHVGQILVSETGLVRVWMIHLEPGERLPFHRHVLTYFWTALGSGRCRSRYADGSVRRYDYTRGETKHSSYEDGEGMTHDLTNIGDEPIGFITVEFLEGDNRPLPL